ncbi:hypothetical protein LVJ94_25570 [Pendulispora rubella]|uniref:RarD protein n=1 Tax=Pendulispora rubella TaxID=2741070 RepID=A0ABZ2LI07_9BACT
MSQSSVGKGASTGAAALAYFILGASSLFWKLLAGIPSPVLLGYRIVVSLVTLCLTTLLLARFRNLLRLATKPKVLLVHLAAAVLVCINWLTFIWGSISGHVLETGIGYLLAPAVTIFIGAGIVRERLGVLRACSLGLCVLGLALLIARSVELKSWIYLTIGLTWGTYGFLKKLTEADPISGLTLETSMLAVGVACVVATTHYTLALPPSTGVMQIGLLCACGTVSVVPLWLLSFAVQKISLSTAGFLQYILPSTQFVVAIVFYGQMPSANTTMCFLVIWSSLTLVVGQSILQRLRTGGPVRTEAGR